MTIRDAVDGDAEGVLNLLHQVLELHAAIRPDIFIPGTTKYTPAEVRGLFADPGRRSYVAVDGGGAVLGYALCILKPPASSNNMHPRSALFIDDLCVDAAARGRGVGQALFAHVKEQAQALGCYQVTLNVWEGNDGARRFYERMGMRPMETVMEYIL